MSEIEEITATKDESFEIKAQLNLNQEDINNDLKAQLQLKQQEIDKLVAATYGTDPEEMNWVDEQYKECLKTIDEQENLIRVLKSKDNEQKGQIDDLIQKGQEQQMR